MRFITQCNKCGAVETTFSSIDAKCIFCKTGRMILREILKGEIE